jgi:hypothetical protein
VHSTVCDWTCTLLRQMAGEAADMDSYFCSVLRLMPMTNIDPSLAIGFYCRTSGQPLHTCKHAPLHVLDCMPCWLAFVVRMMQILFY